MDQHLQNTSATSANKWSHDWFAYQQYLNVHRSYMDALLAEQLVLHEHLTFTETRDGNDLVLVQLEGFLECERGLVVHVSKQMDVRDERGHDHVKTFGFSYHARIPALNLDLLRYDNAHGPLHRHHFDIGTGSETHTELIAEDDMPTLDGVVREACELCLLIVLDP